MWQADKSAEAPGRLENLKNSSVRWKAFESMAGFLEHVALVMDARAEREYGRRLHPDAAFGQRAGIRHRLLPGWEGRAVPAISAPWDEGGRAGLEEERRLAYVGITRRQAPLSYLVRFEPPHPRPLAIDASLTLPRRVAARPCGSRRTGGLLWRLRSRRLRPVALRQGRSLREQLSDGPAGSAPAAPVGRHHATIGAPAPATPSNASVTANRGPARAPSKAELVAQVDERRALPFQCRRPGLPHQVRQRQHRGDRVATS